MKTLTKNFIFIFLSLSFLTSINASSLVDFKDLDLNEISNQGKKILISFSAEWCAPCQVMDQSIYSDQEIATLINDNFIPIKADIDSESGIIWNDLYNANKLPTTLFAQESGKEIERLNGIPSKKEFLNLLNKILAKDINIPKASFVNNSIAKPVPSHAKIVNTASNNSTSASYSIQVGAFSNNENALKMVDKLNHKGVYNVKLLSENTNGKQYQKVIIGDFTSEPAAKDELSFLKAKGIDGFLKKT